MASGDVTPYLLGSPTQLGTSQTLLALPTASYTNITVKQILICNTDGTERLVKMGINSVDADDCFMFNIPIASYDTIIVDTSLPLTYLEHALYGASDTADKVTVTVSGWRTEA
jgi:hypothetical protein